MVASLASRNPCHQVVVLRGFVEDDERLEAQRWAQALKARLGVRVRWSDLVTERGEQHHRDTDAPGRSVGIGVLTDPRRIRDAGSKARVRRKNVQHRRAADRVTGQDDVARVDRAPQKRTCARVLGVQRREERASVLNQAFGIAPRSVELDDDPTEFGHAQAVLLIVATETVPTVQEHDAWPATLESRNTATGMFGRVDDSTWEGLRSFGARIRQGDIPPSNARLRREPRGQEQRAEKAVGERDWRAGGRHGRTVGGAPAFCSDLPFVSTDRLHGSDAKVGSRWGPNVERLPISVWRRYGASVSQCAVLHVRAHSRLRRTLTARGAAMPASAEVEAEERASKPPERGALVFGSMLFFGARITGAFAAFALHWVLARWLGSAEQGRCAEALSWIVLLSTIVLVGLPQAALRFLPAARAAGRSDEIHGFVRFSSRFVWALSVGLALIAAGVVGIWAASEKRALFFAVLVAVPILTAIRHGGGLAHAMSWLGIAALPNNVVRPVLLLAVVAAAWRFGADMSAVEVVAAQVLVMLPILLWQSSVLRRRFADSRSEAPCADPRAWLGVSFPLMLVTLFTGFFPEVNIAVIGQLIGDSELGIFFVGLRVAWLLAFVVSAVDQALVPQISRQYAEGDLDAVARGLARAAALKMFGVGAAALVLGFFGDRVLAVFSADNEYALAYRPMMILVAAQLAISAFGPASKLLSITGHHKVALKLTVVGLALTVLGQALIVPTWGLEGAAAVVLVVLFVVSFAMRSVCIRAIGVDTSILSLVRRG